MPSSVISLQPEYPLESRTLKVHTFGQARDAANALNQDRRTRVLGGGTLIMRKINEGTADFDGLIRTTDPALKRIRTDSSRIELGAAVTMAAILATPELSFLHAVAAAVGGPAIRQMATIGGNLFAPVPYGDFAVALLALDARVQVQASFGTREGALDAILRGPGESSPQLVCSVTFNRPRPGQTLRYHKVARVQPKGVSVLSLAACFGARGERLSSVRLAAGALAPSPIRLSRLERALEGQRLHAAAVDTALQQLQADITPPTDAIASARYRRAVAPVYTHHTSRCEHRCINNVKPISDSFSQ
ncbi:MAG: xanthine dehydrogenase family protein subunit M [Gammaproteobacteria bacterium]|nr:xanthine dehydrogenase family protein subunit M [Gammaproteobacteria bacterium]NKC11673.1 xanthine dehydrogenase family protein subunit M [Gammaproteobacteria bacterium]